MSMNTIMQLRDQRGKAWNKAKNFLEEHRDSNNMLSAKDTATYDRLVEDVHEIGKALEREEHAAAMDAEMSRPTSSPVLLNPRNGRSAPSAMESKVYQDALVAALRSGAPAVSNVLSEGTDSAGGYLVPEEWERKLVQKLEDENIIRKLATVIKTGSDRKINIASSQSTASWVEENGDIVFSDPSFSQRLLSAYKLSVGTKVSDELLEDNQYDLVSFLMNSFGRSLANAEEDAFLNGNGSGKPTGLLHPTEGGEIGVIAQGEAPTVDDIIDLTYKLKRAYRSHAVIITSDSTLSYIRHLKDGTGQLIWQQAFAAGEPEHILGFPVFTSQFMPAIEPGKPVLLVGDLSFYTIADRGSRTIKRLNELYAGNGQVGFVASQRVDGKLILPEAVQILQMAPAANG